MSTDAARAHDPTAAPAVIIDSDRHVIEPTDLWRGYLPRALRDRAPRVIGDELMFEGAPLFGNVGARARAIVRRQAQARFHDMVAASHPQGQLVAMDDQRVDVAYLYPTYALYLAYVDGADARLSCALAQAYNAWLFDYCSADTTRLKGVGLICKHDPPAMLAELERIARFGWRAVVLRPNPIGGRALGDPAFEPFWAACARQSIAVTFHEGTQGRMPTAGADRFHTRFAQHACSHPMEQMMAFLGLLEAGVFQRHPTLRVGFLEAGAGWLPSWLWRLDHLSYPHMREELEPHVTMPPSRYFKRQCWISFEAGEPNLSSVIAAVGLDRLVYGSDYPHPDHGSASIVDQLTGAASADGAARPVELMRAALFENPTRLFTS